MTDDLEESDMAQGQGCCERKSPARGGAKVSSIIDRVDCQLNQQAFRALRKGAASVVALTPVAAVP